MSGVKIIPIGAPRTVRDRLLEMELSRRQAEGRLSEIFGAGSLGGDEETRMFNFTALGSADYALLQKTAPATAQLVDVWTMGVNQRIAEVAAGTAPLPTGLGPSELAFVPQPWSPAEALTVGKLLAWGLSGTLNQDLLATVLQRLQPETFSRLPVVMPAFDSFIVPATIVGPPEPFFRPGTPVRKALPWPLTWRKSHLPPHSASNNWAVSGAFTDSGTPLLAGDPHQTLSRETI